MLFFIAGSALWAFQRGPTPKRWLDELTAGLSQRLDAQVTIEAVRLAGIDRISLHGVRIDGKTPLRARRIVASFSLRELWSRRDAPLDALRWVRLDGLLAELPAGLSDFQRLFLSDSSDEKSPREALRAPPIDDERVAGAAVTSWVDDLKDLLLGHDWVDGTLDVYVADGKVMWQQDEKSPFSKEVPSGEALQVAGTISLTKERVIVRNVRIEGDEWKAAFNGTFLPRADLYVRADGWTDAANGVTLPTFWAEPLHFAGRWQAELWLAGAWDEPEAWGGLQVHSAKVGTGPPRGDEANRDGAVVYDVDELALKWAYRSEQGVDLQADVIRGGARVHLAGNIARDGQLDVDVVGMNVNVPADIPPLAAANVSGHVDVDGTLRGTLSRPVLSADLLSDGGYLFGQPFSELQGQMSISPTAFRFERVRVVQGTSAYYLDGALTFNGTEDGRAAQGDERLHLRLTLQTDNGRAETLTGVLGWDIPVQAVLAGSLQFAGPLGGVAADGDVTLFRGSAWGQPFDKVSGTFRYGDGAFYITDVQGMVRGGTVTATGGTLPDGTGWQLTVAVDDVPLQAAPLLRERLPMVSGMFNFEGTVSNEGEGWNPSVVGAIRGRHLYIGSFDFVEAAGSVEWRNGTLIGKGLTLRRRGGGVYDVTGKVHDVLEAPTLDVAMSVRGESVGQLLALTDWRLPLLAHSEPIQVEAVVQGDVHSPEATIHIATDAVYVVGRGIPFALDLRLKDGRIEVEQLSGTNSVQVKDHSS